MKNMPAKKEEYQLSAQRMVRKANSLIQLNGYIESDNKNTSLSITEAKLLALALSKIEPEDTKLHPVVIDYDEYWALCDVEPTKRSAYNRRIVEAVMNLRNRATWMIKYDPVQNRPYATPVSWLNNKPQFFSDKAIIEFDPDLAPALLQLKANHTEYPVISVMKLTSKYGFALYEYIASVEKIQHPIILSFDEIADICDARSYRTRPGDMKKRVIVPALEDINENSPDYYITYEFLKTQRTMTHVSMYVRHKSKLDKAGEKPLTDEERLALCTAEVKDQIGYEAYAKKMLDGEIPDDLNLLSLIVEIMAMVYYSPQGTYTISGVKVPGTLVVERYKTITRENVEFVISSIHSIKTKVQNTQSYLRASLYNAPLSMDVKKATEEQYKNRDRRELDSDELAAIKRMMEEDD